ncbi:MAG: HEAT repeat domain-containing protein [Aggregatilineales bacterium]
MTDLTLEDYFALLANGDIDERRNAAWYLGRQRDDRVILPLISALADPDDDVRLRVVEALGNLRDDRTVMPLVSALAEDNPKIRAQVVASLGRQRDFRAFQALLDLLYDGDAGVRTASAEGLGKLPDDRAIMPLISVMLDDEDDDVRYFASKSVLAIGGKNVVDGLLLVLQSQPSAGSIITILEILAELKDVRAIPQIEALKTHPDDGVSATAKWALTQLG